MATETRKAVVPDMPPIVVDTREQRGYWYPGCQRKCLEIGDYSLVGFEERVAIERKSLGDAYQSIGHARDRFRKEVEKLAKLEYSAIVVEATLAEFLAGPPDPEGIKKMNPRAAVHSLLSWEVEFPRLHVHWAGSKDLSRGLVFHLLRHFWRKHGGQVVVDEQHTAL